MLQIIQNLKYGDTVTFLASDNQERTLKIVGVVDNFEPYFKDESIIKVLLSIDKLETYKKELEGTGLEFLADSFKICIDTDKANLLDGKMKELNIIRTQEGKIELRTANIYEFTNTDKVEELSRRAMVKIPLYTVVRFTCITQYRKYI